MPKRRGQRFSGEVYPENIAKWATLPEKGRNRWFNRQVEKIKIVKEES